MNEVDLFGFGEAPAPRKNKGGRPPGPGRRKPPRILRTVEVGIPDRPDPSVYARLVAQGVGKGKAAQMAGYSAKTAAKKIEDNHREICAYIPEARAKLQAEKRLTLEDQAGFYKGVRDRAGHDIEVRLKAATRLDKILGYEAPSNAPQGGGTQITQAVQIIQQYVRVVNTDVNALIDELQTDPGVDADFEDVE